MAEATATPTARPTVALQHSPGFPDWLRESSNDFGGMPIPNADQTYPVQDAAELIRAAVFAQRVASPDIEVELEEPTPEVALLADGRMLAQALTNVLKNAAEAIGARRNASDGLIRARLISDDSGVTFEVEDNGIGLPAKDRDRLTEPYVTTREKGTGLGLAIVKRILEDHGGELILTDSTRGRGARAILKLPAMARVRALDRKLASLGDAASATLGEAGVAVCPTGGVTALSWPCSSGLLALCGKARASASVAAALRVAASAEAAGVGCDGPLDVDFGAADFLAAGAPETGFLLMGR